AKGVKRTRSAKRTVTSRRSASGSAVAARTRAPAMAGATVAVEVPATAPLAAAPSRVEPHSLQKRAPGWLGVPQFGQTAASRSPQLLQNLLPAGFSVPQLGQFSVIPRIRVFPRTRW